MKPASLAALNLLLLLLLIAGCATIAEDQCATTDWYLLGSEDGRKGFSGDRLNRHYAACARVQVIPDGNAWETGRQIGLVEYCRLPNAVEQGLMRHSYQGVCTDPRFARVYNAARALGETRQEIESIDRELERGERELLTDRKLNISRRGELLAELRMLERQRERAQNDRYDAELRLDWLRSEIGF
ncbi:MAG: DUF2799 domain-containing protein [Desulforhopalus sp.]|jgi:hypothetical protein|nr:DUF2799 domain-containing protein [Desulforhopalus sp.]